MRRFVVFSLVLTACLSPVDYAGTSYRCPDGTSCPDGFQCVAFVCQEGPPVTPPDADPALPDGGADAMTPRPDAAPGAPDAGPVDDVVLVDVPAGDFKRGCSTFDGDDCRSDTEPQRQITLAAYRIDAHEVTQGAYAACVAARACRAPSAHYDPAGKPHHPVTNVTWSDADAYCRFAGKRLPTEAEWEKAARGGGTDSRRYPWGQTGPDCGRVSFDNCTSGPAPVASHDSDASPFGVTEMAGNVAEWVADYYASDYYVTGPATDPTGPASGDKRVVRGGDFESTAEFLRTFDRDPWPPSTTKDFIGFRCAR